MPPKRKGATQETLRGAKVQKPGLLYLPVNS